MVRLTRRRLATSASLCAFAFLVSAPAMAQYTVKYNNGAAIEVVAVSKLPSRHKPFWDPSGVKLVEPPYEFRDASDVPRAQQQGYEIVLRLIGVENRAYFPFRGPAGGIFVDYPRTVYAANPAQEQLRVIHVTVTVSDGTDVIDFELAMAANTWKTIRSFKTAGSYGEGPNRVNVVELKDNETISYPNRHYWVHLAPSEDALRAIAIDQEGKTHISSGAWAMGAQEHTLYLDFPNLPHEKVKEYRVEKCVYETQSFKAIHLKPPGDWDALVLQSRINRLMAQELKFNPQTDPARIDDDIEKIVRLRIFEDTDNWIIAVRDLTQIGPPAIPAIVAEMRHTSRPYARSGLAMCLRAIDDPRAVPGLIEALADCPFAPNDYGGARAKDNALTEFMMSIQRGGGYRGGEGPMFDFGRPVNEISETLETLTGFKVEGRFRMQNDRAMYEDAATRWRTWWEKNKEPLLRGLPPIRVAALAKPYKQLLPDDATRFASDLKLNPKLADQSVLDRWTMLHLAIVQGDVALAKVLIEGGANVNSAGYGGWTPLHLACAMQQIEIVKLLLEKGADVKAKATDGCTTLHAAVGMGPAPFYNPSPKPDVKLVNLLIEKGVDAKAVGGRGKTALHGAVACGDLAVVELLMDVGVPVDAKDARGRTALHRAVECGDEKTVDSLLAAGADVNAKDADGRTPIKFSHYSLYYNDFNSPILSKLLARGAEVDLPATIALGTVEQVAAAIKRNPAAINEKAKTDYEETPLHFAIRRKSPQMLKILLEAGADANAKQKDGNTPLHSAVFSADKQIIAALIAAKADVNAAGQGDCTPLYWACTNLNVEVVDQLLAAGAKTNLPSKWGYSPLSAAFSGTRDNNRNRPDPQPKMERARAIVKALLAHQADPNAVTSTDHYPIIFFAPLELMDLLLENGAKLDVTNDNGDTILHQVAALSREEMIPYLLQHGLSLEAKNKKGETPLIKSVNFMEPRGQTLKLLLDAGADLKAKDNKGNTALHGAAQQGGLKSIAALLDKGADVEAKDNDGATPLHLAAKAGRDQAILLLLKRGAAIDSTDAAGRTPLQWATNEKTRKLLIDQGAVDAPAK